MALCIFELDGGGNCEFCDAFICCELLIEGAEKLFCCPGEAWPFGVFPGGPKEACP